MKTISVINYKGGVGKTTITANLAAELARKDYRVLVIDLDPQTNLTFSFIQVDEWQNKYEEKNTIKYWFDSIIEHSEDTPDFSDLIIKDNSGKIDLICSHLGLIDVDIELAAGLSSATEKQHKMNYVTTYSHIKKELVKLKDSYDIVLFDCPPNFSIVTKNALIASDYYIVPAKMDYLSTLGINQLRSNVNNLVEQYNRYSNTPVDPKFLGVIPTMVSIRNDELISAQDQYYNQLIESDILIFDNMIRENKTAYASAPEYGTPVVMQSHSYGNTYWNVVKELQNLCGELIDKVGI